MTTENMNDRELLELAAKAAGLKISNWIGDIGRVVAVLDDFTYWQPLYENELTDCDGDAQRLAVNLALEIRQFDDGHGSLISSVWSPAIKPVFEKVIDSRFYATRCAIVRAAAEIGKEMP